MKKYTTTSENEQSVLKERLLRYFRAWPIFVATLVVCLIAAYGYLRYAVPLYRVNTTILIKDDKKESGEQEKSDFNYLQMFRAGHNMDNEMEVLKSKKLLRNVLADLNLQTTLFVKGKVVNYEIYGDSAPVKVMAVRLTPLAFKQAPVIHIIDKYKFEYTEGTATTIYKFGQLVNRPYGAFAVELNRSNPTQLPLVLKFNDLDALAEQYETDNLSVNPVTNKNATVLTLTFISSIPQKGVDILNKLIEVYKNDALNDKNALAATTIQFIDERLKYLTDDLNNVEKNVEQFKRQNSVTDITSNAQVYVEQSTSYDKQIAEDNLQLNLLQSIEAYLKKPANQNELVPSTLGIQDPTLISLISKFNDLQSDKERLLRTVQPNSPLITNMNEQINTVKGNILENLKNIMNGIMIARNSLLQNSSTAQSKIQSVPLIERGLQEIKRQQGIKENLYLYLLQKREESALSLAATNSNTRVTDPPRVENMPFAPKKGLAYLCACWLSIVLPVIGLFLRDLFNTRIRTLNEVEANTNIPILGEICNTKVPENKVVVKNRSMIAELFNLIRTNLMFRMHEGEKVILITSSMSAEGKTFFTLNLAASLALLNKKVVVLDFDLRKPSLLNKLNINNDKGISDYLVADDVMVSSIVSPSNILPSLYVIGAGYVCPNPAELIAGSKVGRLINILRENFDYVIIDTSPIGQVADAFSLSAYIDCCIYLMRYNFTYINQMDILNNIKDNDKIKKMMIVMNDAKKYQFKTYGYGYYRPKEAGTAVG